MGVYDDRASLQVQGVSSKGFASKVRSAIPLGCFWPVAMGAYDDRVSLQVQGVSSKGLAEVCNTIGVFLACRNGSMRGPGIPLSAGGER